MALIVNGSDRATWTVAAGATYSDYSTRTPLTGDDVVEVWYTNDNAARELWVDAVNVGGPAPLAYRAYLPAMRHAEGTPQPAPAPSVTVQAEGGAMLYGRGSFQAPNVVPGQERLDEGGALRFVLGTKAYAAEYDANGNMTSRVVAGQAQVLDWDAENRLVTARQGTSVSTFTYDGDGKRVKATVDGTVTIYVGNYYEQRGSTIRTYYFHASLRIAMREGGTLHWLLADHLGSMAVSATSSGSKEAELRYEAWGETRYQAGTPLSDYRFTGQRYQDMLDLYDYGARCYDPISGRFLSADTIVPQPGNPQSLNRFSYCLNNPLRYIDPTGHDGGWNAAWVQRFSEAHGGTDPTEKDWQDYLYSLSHPGTDLGGSWSRQDWVVYTLCENPSDDTWAGYLQVAALLGGLAGYIGANNTDVWAFLVAEVTIRDLLGGSGSSVQALATARPGPDRTVYVTGPVFPRSGGFTIGSFVNLPPAFWQLSRDDRRFTEIHEYVHVLQYREEGFAMLGRYLKEGPYDWDHNAYEVQARAVENVYRSNAGLRPAAPWDWIAR